MWPYVKSQKTDDRDAEAIAEAATRPRCALRRSRARSNSICRCCTRRASGWSRRTKCYLSAAEIDHPLGQRRIPSPKAILRREPGAFDLNDACKSAAKIRGSQSDGDYHRY